jgi:hypothetical protein
MANRRCAEWRFPTEKQARAEETLMRMQQNAVPPDVASQAAPATPVGPGDPMPEAYWAAVLAEPVARTKPGIHISQRRLSEIPRHVLRVSCRRCDRTIEIQTTDAQRLYGPHAIWKDVGRKLLDNGCQQRTGSHEDDGCWPSFDTP